MASLLLYARISGSLSVQTFLNAPYTADGLSGLWTIEITNLEHEVITTMVVRFSQEPAASCLAGNWRKVEVESFDSSNEKFFPVSQPLAFHIENDQIGIGRAHVCDAYLFFRGEMIDSTAMGEFVDFGIFTETKHLGYFSLTKNAE